MTEHNDNAPREQAEPAAATAAETDPFSVLEKLQEENKALAEEAAGMKDRLLRTLAEMENLRRRTDREVADAKSYGVTAFARDMLTFGDNLHRALAAVPAAALEDADGTLKSFVQGVELTEKDFQSRLARHGVKKIEPHGLKFDPNHHEALFEAPDESVPHGTVTQVVEHGYTIGERVLRPAKVGVSRGGPKG